MKKKLLIILTAIIMILSCAFAFVACGGGDEAEGTYYTYYEGQKRDGFVMELKSGKFTFSHTKDSIVETTNGTYAMDGKNIKVTTTDGSKSETVILTYISDGVYYCEEIYYCKDGKTPPADEN